MTIERDRATSTRVETWEARTEWPLAVAALAFLAAYAWPILNPQLGHDWRVACLWVDYIAWAMFVVDYVARLCVAEHRVRYAWKHLADLVVIALPILRPLRLLRLLMILKVMNRRAETSLRGRVAIYVGGATSLVILCAALAVLDAERGHHGANIETFGDALWWAVVTVSTVGYGDRYPVTAQGRLIGVGLMLAGVALLGVVTAAIASWLIERVRDVEAEAQAATRHDVAELRAEIRALRGELANGRLPGSVAQ